MTAADTRVGDADVSGRSEGGVTTAPPPPLVWGYPPFLGRHVVIRSGIARGKPVGTGETGVSARKVLPARKNLPAWKRLPVRKILPALWQ